MMTANHIAQSITVALRLSIGPFHWLKLLVTFNLLPCHITVHHQKKCSAFDWMIVETAKKKSANQNPQTLSPFTRLKLTRFIMTG